MLDLCESLSLKIVGQIPFTLPSTKRMARPFQGKQSLLHMREVGDGIIGIGSIASGTTHARERGCLLLRSEYRSVHDVGILGVQVLTMSG